MAVTITASLCPQNHKCPAVDVCPVEALSQEGLLAPEVDADLCTDCGECAKTCPTGALKID